MGDETQAKEINLNRQQLLWIAQGMSGFKHLSTDVGERLTEAIIDLIFDAQVRETNPDGRYILIDAAKRDDFADQINLTLLTECAQIRLKRAYAAELFEEMKDGKLRNRLTANTEREKSYFVPRRRMPASQLECNILKAGDWIAQSIRDDRKHAIHGILTRNIVTAPDGKALGSTTKLLDQVHTEIAADAPKVRSPNSNAAYPSSIGGRFLLDLIFKWTSLAVWPKPGDPLWLDIALFYLGAVATVQGYADGNKRTGRMAYAITLLKGGHDFVAPNAALESDLIRMIHSEIE